jgi:hypothetical protein
MFVSSITALQQTRKKGHRNTVTGRHRTDMKPEVAATNYYQETIQKLVKRSKKMYCLRGSGKIVKKEQRHGASRLYTFFFV